MSSSQHPGIHPGEYDWNQAEISAEALNRPIVKIQRGRLDGTRLELFLRIPDGSPRHRYQLETIAALCSEQNRVKFGAQGEEIAWLHDRSRDGEQREKSGWLTQPDLHAALKAKRFNEDKSKTPGMPNADRRLLYIPNLDFRSLEPLILTASHQQALALSEFLWKYLKADCSIGVSFLSDGRSFSLEFHIPYYVWSKDKEMPCDKRKRPDKSPLRKSTCLSFLTKYGKKAEDDSELDCLHEVQWSCVVAGYNTTVWNGYGLTDTYLYDAESLYDRSTPRYFQEDDLQWWDPISGVEANITAQDPREYFLNALHTHVGHIKEEWENIVFFLRQAVDPFVHDEDLFRADNVASLGAADDRSKALQDLQLSTKQTSRLLTDLTQNISNLTKTWEAFKAKNLHWFRGLNNKGNRLDLAIHSIDKIFESLQSCQVDLENIKNKHDDFNKSLELYLQVENRRAIVLQQYNINLIQIISSPALTSAMMQSGVLPWSGFLPWFIITVLLWGVTAAVQPALTWYHRSRVLRRKGLSGRQAAQATMLDDFVWTPDGLPYPEPTLAPQKDRDRWDTSRAWLSKISMSY